MEELWYFLASMTTGVQSNKKQANYVWQPDTEAFRTVEEYDPATDTWEKKTDAPTARS